MKQIEMIKGARKIVGECTGVQRGENVLIIVETKTPLSIAQTLAIACKERGAEPTIIITSPVEVDGIDPSPPVGEAMQKADVILLGVRGTFHGPSRIKATKAGARCLIIVGFTEEDLFEGFIEVDFLKHREFVEEVARALGRAKEARITTPAGTDLRFDLRGRLEKVVTFHGIYTQPGDAGALNLEVAVSPKIGAVEGVIVCDASTTLLQKGLIKTPVRAIVKDGKVTQITGGVEASRIAASLAAMADPRVYNVVELGIGVNPKLTITGSHKDKGAYGTCHIGIGSNITWGGDIKAATHGDLIMYAPKIELDGKTVVENHQFTL